MAHTPQITPRNTPFAYPIVLSNAVWKRAVDRDPGCSVDLFGRRLAQLTATVYQQLIDAPGQASSMLHLMLDTHEHQGGESLDLQLMLVADGTSKMLQVTLAEEHAVIH